MAFVLERMRKLMSRSRFVEHVRVTASLQSQEGIMALSVDAIEEYF